MWLNMVFAYLSVQENLHSKSYEVNVCSINTKMKNSEKGERLNVNSLNVNVLHILTHSLQKGFI